MKRWRKFEAEGLEAHGSPESWTVLDAATKVKIAYVDLFDQNPTRYEVVKPRGRKVLAETRTLREAITFLAASR